MALSMKRLASSTTSPQALGHCAGRDQISLTGRPFLNSDKCIRQFDLPRRSTFRFKDCDATNTQIAFAREVVRFVAGAVEKSPACQRCVQVARRVMEMTKGASCPWNLSTVPTLPPGRRSCSSKTSGPVMIAYRGSAITLSLFSLSTNMASEFRMSATKSRIASAFRTRVLLFMQDWRNRKPEPLILLF